MSFAGEPHLTRRENEKRETRERRVVVHWQRDNPGFRDWSLEHSITKENDPPRGIRKFHWQLEQIPYEYRSLVGEVPHPWAPLWSKIVHQQMHSIGLGTCRLDRSGESQPTLPTPDRSRLTEILTGPGVFRCAACSRVRWKYLCAAPRCIESHHGIASYSLRSAHSVSDPSTQVKREPMKDRQSDPRPFWGRCIVVLGHQGRKRRRKREEGNLRRKKAI